MARHSAPRNHAKAFAEFLDIVQRSYCHTPEPVFLRDVRALLHDAADLMGDLADSEAVPDAEAAVNALIGRAEAYESAYGANGTLENRTPLAPELHNAFWLSFVIADLRSALSSYRAPALQV